MTPAADDEAEAEGVVRRLLAHRFEHRGSFSDYAILYRGNHQAKVFEQQLRAQNAPYEISGGQSYFERTEIKDLVAYLRLIANDDDDPAFIRAVTTPKRGDRRDDARAAGRPRRRSARRASSPRCSPTRRRRRFPRASARCSMRSAR